MLNNNNNSSCMFAEEIVSYLYNETTVKEKLAFEAHLKNCLMCADEFAGFGFVRSSLTEWRNDEVFALEMPRLENPAIKSSAPVVSTTSGSWLDNLRELLAWFPARKTAAVAFAAVIIVVLTMFFINSTNNNEIASNTDQNPAKDSMLKSDKAKEEVSAKSETAPQNPDNEKEKSKVTETVSKDSAPKNSPQKRKLNVAKTNETIAENSVNKEKKNNNIQKQEVPTLTGIGEEEDKSLRLADLFDEIDTKLY